MTDSESGGSGGESPALSRVAKLGLFSSGAAGVFAVAYWYANRTAPTLMLWDPESAEAGLPGGHETPVETGASVSPLTFATVVTALVAIVTLALWKSSPSLEDDEGPIRTDVYADSLPERVAHLFDGIVREQFEEPAMVTIQWSESAGRDTERSEKRVDGIILEPEDWLRLDVTDESAGENLFWEIDLGDVWLVWIDDPVGKRALHFASDEAYEEWKREHPEAALESPTEGE